MATVTGNEAVEILVVDLDGTLVLTNLLHESLFALARQNPWMLFKLPMWLARGRAYFETKGRGKRSHRWGCPSL